MGQQARISAAILMVLGGCSADDSGRISAVPQVGCSSAERTLSVGGVEPPAHIFGEVPDVAQLSGGRIAALDRQAAELQIFDSTGVLVEVYGGPGEGPGELVDPIALDVYGSNVLVWDWRQSRITRYDLSLGNFETIPVRAQPNPTSHFGVLEDGGYVFGTNVGGPAAGDENALWTMELGIVVLRSPDSGSDTVALIPDQTMGWVDRSIRRAGTVHFSPRAAATVSGGELYWSRGDAPLIIRESDAGPDSIVWDWEDRRVLAEDVERYRSNWLAETPSEMRPSLNRTLDAMPAAELYPVVRYLVPDHDGGVWAQIYNRPQDTTRLWMRLEAGAIDCRIELPVDFIASEGARRWLLGVGSDSLDVERVERWEISDGQR